jgi:viologen exporter family transport system permease protein
VATTNAGPIGARGFEPGAPPPFRLPSAPVTRTLRAFPTLLKVGFAEAVAYRAEMFVWLLSTNMPLVMLALWTAVARDAPVGRFGQKDFVAYYLATLVVRLLTGAWVIWELNFEIRQGTLAFRLLRPVHPLLAYAAENLSALPVRMLISLPIAVIALAVVGGERVTHDPVLLAILPLTILGAWLITFLAMAIIGSLAFWVDQAGSLFEIWLGLFGVFSGYLVPLELFPDWVEAVARFLPFRYMLAFPVEMVIGMTPRAAALGELAVQWGFVGLLGLGARLTWRLGLRRFAAFGG